ncbi:hypothetical protein GCM10010166_64310 [Couchioplanes caeruleus subsp. azureus]|nr:hypothetical protein GCM10010166_64310 [Couchioplanes caeruleus subsp. azureus]
MPASEAVPAAATTGAVRCGHPSTATTAAATAATGSTGNGPIIAVPAAPASVSDAVAAAPAPSRLLIAATVGDATGARMCRSAHPGGGTKGRSGIWGGPVPGRTLGS